MKQVSYNFDWPVLAASLVERVKTFYGIEDGYWQVGLTTESVTSSFPAPVEGAAKMVLPGHLIRVTGIVLTKVPTLGFMCIQIENGQIIDVDTTTNTDQRAPQESGGAVGEDRRYPREVFMSPIAAGLS